MHSEEFKQFSKVVMQEYCQAVKAAFDNDKSVIDMMAFIIGQYKATGECKLNDEQIEHLLEIANTISSRCEDLGKATDMIIEVSK